MMNLTLTKNCDSVEVIEDSAVIAQVGYSRTSNELYVEFKNGSVYTYIEVPESVYIEFLNADSRGNYLNTEIVPEYFSFKLDEI